ncbi:MAG: signal peptidase I [Kineosporiaceae bacterium]
MTEPSGTTPASDGPGADPFADLTSSSGGSAPTTAAVADRAGSDDVVPNRSRAFLSVLRETVLVIAIALTLSLLLKTFLIQTFYIPSESMENTLVKDDRVVVSKLTPGPFDLHRGDVVVFEDPGGWVQHKVRQPAGPVRTKLREGLIFVGLLPNDSKEHVIKRVIGLPGDTVACDTQDRVTVNGVAIDETYLKPGSRTCDVWTDRKVVVPEGHLWVMGDNRNDSGDSRFRGPIPQDNVVGKAFVLVWPLDRSHLLRTPHVFDRVPDAS